MNTSPAFSFTALALKIVGVVMIVSSLLDYILMTIPFNPGQREWQIAVATQFVDRGVIPLVGIIFVLLGYLVDNSSGGSKSLLGDLRFWALLFSSILGLIYLMLVPLHFSNVNAQTNQALEQINTKATQAQTQVTTEETRFKELIKNPQQLAELDKAIASGQVQGQQLSQLQALKQQLDIFKKNPKALDEKIKEANQQIAKGKQEAETRTKNEALKLSLRTGLNSLFLAIGFIGMGWIGLRGLISQSSRR